ncbi:proline-rich protein 18 [Lampris incognitus]|uniref:proline-rich protein 18 n=1 Tax=Lampris incognitus TaxID=2546036 RepID=UPI0024B622CE|nr:proline-rich protein 18 [Lampris incognitus]
MPFPPIHLHQRLSSPGRELFGKKKAGAAPPPPGTSGEEKERDREKFPASWTSANLRNLGRKPKPPKAKSPVRRLSAGQDAPRQDEARRPAAPKARSNSAESASRRGSKQSSRSSLGRDEAEKEARFTLSLTPEAILVIQKRNLEKQMLARQQKCCASADFRHRRVFPSRKAHAGARGGAPAARPEEAGQQDITAIVKISLLNDQYKYDDVEYEEEDADVDETVVRKCKEWLRGVESAAAFGRVDRLAALSHLKGC